VLIRGRWKVEDISTWTRSLETCRINPYSSERVISEIQIQKFKSINDLTLKLGRVTMLIGENGCGKSNILEGVAFAGGAIANKLDNEYLFNRGIRVADWSWMLSAFLPYEAGHKFFFRVKDDGLGDELHYLVEPEFRSEDKSFQRWTTEPIFDERDMNIVSAGTTAQERRALAEGLLKSLLDTATGDITALRAKIEIYLARNADKLGLQLATNRARLARAEAFADASGMGSFLIYAPENTVLRSPPPEGAIEPLGVRGEGVIKLLQSFVEPDFADRLPELKERLTLFDWFEDFTVPDLTAINEARLSIRDRRVELTGKEFDQRSANEGFLLVLFYLTALISWRTPPFFAIDNLDNALNPKLCAALMAQVVGLAKKYGKQVICTAHNPAILDGLDLHDDEQRLYVVRRDEDGATTLHRVRPPQPRPGEAPVRLSEAFMRGLIGGLPENF
jgi:predicted ATPase